MGDSKPYVRKTWRGRPVLPWASVDWSQQDSVIAEAMGTSVQNVCNTRRTHRVDKSEHTNERTPKTQAMYFGFAEVRIKLAICHLRLLIARTEREMRRLTPIGSWEEVDWSDTDAIIAYRRGVSRERARQKRLAMGMPSVAKRRMPSVRLVGFKRMMDRLELGLALVQKGRAEAEQGRHSPVRLGLMATKIDHVMMLR